MLRARVPRLASVALASTVAHFGCEVLGGFEELEPAPLGAAAPHRCDPLAQHKADGLGLATMALIKTDGGRCFWIDETEVTVGQYASFVAQSPAFSGWDAQRCAWKTELSKPHTDAGDACAAGALAGDAAAFDPQRPVRCVDYCDARAFCTWAQKDLCFGSEGDASDEADWGTACGRGQPYPYGSALEPGACNIDLEPGQCAALLSSPCRAADVRYFVDCTYPDGPFDMLGNVAEWTVSCAAGDSGPGTKCGVRGGSYADPLGSANCNAPANAALPLESRRPDVGFRCCDALSPGEEATLTN